MGSTYTSTLWTGPFPIKGVSCLFLLSCFVEISELNAKSIDSDQTPLSGASDLGLHCLPASLLWEARLIWVNGLVDFHQTCITISLGHAFELFRF